jgi:hypothetical protein
MNRLFILLSKTKGLTMIYTSWRRIALTAASALIILSLAACGSSPKNKEPAVPRAPIKSVALIPAYNKPLAFEYSVSHFVPFGISNVLNGVNAGIGKANAEIINDKLKTQGYDIGKLMTELVVKQLQDSGLVVEVLDKIERKPGEPDEIDYTKLTHNSDAILHLYFNELIYQTPRGESAYWPRVSTVLQAYDKSGKNYLFEANTYLDRGAKESKSGYFDAKNDLSFADQDVMVKDLSKVRVAFDRIATQAGQYLGKRMAELSR